jgi:hypothetical protein
MSLKKGKAQAQPQPQPVIPMAQVGEDVKVSTMARFAPESFTAYINELRSSKLLSAMDEREFDEWTQRLVSFIDKSIVLSKMKPFEIHPISNPEVYLRSYMHEVLMDTNNLQINVKKKLDECSFVMKNIHDFMEQEDKRKLVEDCQGFMKHVIQLSLVGNEFIIEFVNRKSQFSLTLGLMPNSAKGVVGIWTD